MSEILHHPPESKIPKTRSLEIFLFLQKFEKVPTYVKKTM